MAAGASEWAMVAIAGSLRAAATSSAGTCARCRCPSRRPSRRPSHRPSRRPIHLPDSACVRGPGWSG